jgi:hypothetical protein
MRKLIAVLVLVSLMFSTATVAAQGEDGPVAGGKGAKANVEQSYIVQMVDDPVVAYDGGVPGYQATKPAKGEKINPRSREVVAYAGYLQSKHNEALNRVGGRKLYDYQYTFNGFSAVMSEDQAAALAQSPGVLAVTKNEVYTVDTSSTPTFLGLDAPGGLWEQLGGVGSAGEDIIIGIVDSGIWPESLSFSDRTGSNGNASKEGKLSYQQIPGWHGKCVPGEDFNASLCNQKLIGAQYFNAGAGGNAGIDTDRPWEFNSVRDYNGHGTHTASTAGGNANVPTDGPAAVFGPVSGIAPRARIAAYKALWSTQDASTASGNTADLVAAIDQAVADGVDVINYSISGTQTNFRDPVEIAFMFAADAGVFVAASAGNSGPTTSTVAHPSPWITTVAAGTHNRDGRGSVTLGNGTIYEGASVAATAVTAPFIDSVDAGLPGADPVQVALCYSSADGGNVLDPAKVAGKIVLCDRGVTARVNKSLAVMEAGGVGMVLVNVGSASINADFHFVPSVHVNDVNNVRAELKAYAATAGATATINVATIVYNAPAPFTASFSSRGPLRAGGGDLLKPDVIAPGQDILAAVAPPGNRGLNFNLYSGTSMSSPHTAGLAALLMDMHPDWSPMMVKSALMTSAYDVLDGPNTNPLVIFRQGAGHVRPNSAADPGLVYDSNIADFFGFLCGTQLPVSFCNDLGFPVLDPSDFNSPSIALGDLAGIQTVTREVTNVGSSAATYNASVTGVAGIDVVVTPTALTLQPGETGAFTVTFTRTTATLNAYVGGYLTWSDGVHSVRSPIVIRPVALAAPVQVSGSYSVKFGYNGPFTATARGLVPAVTSEHTVLDDPTDSTCSLTSPNAVKIPVTIPAGTTYTRYALFDDFTDGNDDLDMCVFQGTTLVGSSGSGTSAEEVNFVFATPTAGAIALTVVVQGWETDGPDANFTFFQWNLGTANAGNMTVTAPATAVLGQTAQIELAFSGLTPGVKYLGSVAYSGAAGMPNPTIVRVDP